MKSKSMNKKGFAFSLDLIAGIVIVFIVLIFASFLLHRGSEFDLSQHNLILVGSDLVTVMDNQEIFDTLDHDYIEEKMQEILPGNYQMLLRVEGNFSTSNGLVEVGSNLPEDRNVFSGRKVALTNESVYLKITYFIWGMEDIY